MRSAVITTLAFTFIALGAAQAAEPASCKKVRLSDPGWTDVTAITATASVILEALGYSLPDDRAALGVSLLSQRETLLRQIGLNRLNRAILSDSDLRDRLWGLHRSM